MEGGRYEGYMASLGWSQDTHQDKAATCSSVQCSVSPNLTNGFYFLTSQVGDRHPSFRASSYVVLCHAGRAKEAIFRSRKAASIHRIQSNRIHTVKSIQKLAALIRLKVATAGWRVGTIQVQDTFLQLSTRGGAYCSTEHVQWHWDTYPPRSG